MTQANYAEYYLGANTPNGFTSLFSESYDYMDGWRAYIIKGGPGTGKSTLMKKLCARCEDEGIFCERVYCSSDPDSLDAVIIPSMKTAVYDGTAPHVLEPKYPGACENIINTGQAWDARRLYAAREDIIRLSDQCSACHRNATRMLSCAYAFRLNTRLLTREAFDAVKLRRTAENLYSKYIGVRGSSRGRQSRRLISAVTPQGVRLLDAACAMCDTIVPISDRYDLPSGELTASLCELLLERGMDIITCLCSQDFSRIEHIIVPEASVMFTVSGEYHALPTDARIIHTERFLSAGFVSSNKQKISFNRRAEKQFIDLAVREMQEAKAIHDKLEAIYIGAMNFDIVADITDHAMDAIFG